MILAFGLINIITILAASMVLAAETENANNSNLNDIIETENLLTAANDVSPLGKKSFL